MRSLKMNCLKPLAVLMGVLFISLNIPVYAGVQNLKVHNSILDHLENLTGEYQGEVRLQTADGLTNQLVVDHARLVLSISGDEMTIKPASDLIGKGCGSKISSVREVMEFPSAQNEVMEASFDFN